MGLYEGIKDVANVIQKADNIELYSKLLDLSAQALELQKENTRLEDENNRLRKQEDLTQRIIRHSETYITLKDDESKIMYCSCCWDNSNKLIQLKKYEDGDYSCLICKNQGYYDRTLYKANMSKYSKDGVFIV